MRYKLIGLTWALVALGGCTNEQTESLQIPQCENGLVTTNKVSEINPTTNEFKVLQDCNPKGGEGPQIQTIYTYKITANEIKLENTETGN